MKTFNLLNSILLTAILFVGTLSVHAETETLFSFTGTGSSSYLIFTNGGWSSDGTAGEGGYVQIGSNKATGAVISPLYNAHTDLSFSYTIATYTGTNSTETRLLVLDEDDNVKATHALTSASSTSYITGTPVTIGDISYKFKIKIETTISTQGTRLRNIILTGTPSSTPTPIPLITVTEASIPEMQAEVGSTDTQEINVSGSDLTDNIEITIEGANYDQFFVLPETLTQTGGVVASTVVTVTYSPTTAGPHTATLKITSTGATEKTFDLSGITEIPQELVVTSIDEDFDDGTLPTGWTASASGVSFGSGGAYDYVALASNGAELITPKIKNPKDLSLLLYRTTATEARYLYVMVSTTIDGTYTTVETFDLDNTTSSYEQYDIDLSAYISDEIYIKFRKECASGSSPWRIDWIKVNGVTPTITVTENSVPAMSAKVGESDTKEIHVSGEDLTGNIEFTIEGDNAALFSVSPKPLIPQDGTVAETTVTITYSPTSIGTHSAVLKITSEGAEPVTFDLSGTGLDTGTGLNEYEANGLNLYASNGYIYFNALGGKTVEIYNTLGVCLYKGITIEGMNSIKSAPGIALVKINGTVAGKVIVR